MPSVGFMVAFSANCAYAIGVALFLILGGIEMFARPSIPSSKSFPNEAVINMQPSISSKLVNFNPAARKYCPSSAFTCSSKMLWGFRFSLKPSMAALIRKYLFTSSIEGSISLSL